MDRDGDVGGLRAIRTGRCLGYLIVQRPSKAVRPSLDLRLLAVGVRCRGGDNRVATRIWPRGRQPAAVIARSRRLNRSSRALAVHRHAGGGGRPRIPLLFFVVTRRLDFDFPDFSRSRWPSRRSSSAGA
ncbi:hypothetical protein GI374_09415 [Paracoccus sp. S-4012]|uniref:hypothetical protein n=1 Tax=Paracoccus sp. S-4012 TaxID=2665648 RepID=UPI0012AF39F8|nr:hypothetical protein [Paracoccus sp. S-4012]MRX50660.1 hypothetical protein [Paracoccus sp. S-4012]